MGMRFAVVGAGSIGGYLGARLALAGEAVTFVARGRTLDSLRENGIRLIEENGIEQHTRRIDAVSMDAATPHDVVLLALKAHQVPDVLEGLPRLLGPETMVVTLQNGIPWWYFHGIDSPHAGRSLRSVDPDGRVAATIGVHRVIGSVVYPAAEIVSPGVIQVIEGNRFTLGEPDHSATPRVQALSEALTRAGFKAPVSSDLRAEIWLKLWGNLSFNPISALTGATLAGICRDPGTRALAARMMAEAQAVGEALGVRFRMSIERRIAGAEAVGEHKTSMLQDIEAGRPLELDALLGSVRELGQIAGVGTPTLDAVYALTALADRTRRAA